MNTHYSSKNTLIVQVPLPEQFRPQIPERFLKSVDWKSHLSEILKCKITEAELVGAMRRSVSSRQSESEEAPESPHSIPVSIESEFRFDHLNRNDLKKRLSLIIRSRIRLDDLLHACERCLKLRKTPKEKGGSK